MDRLGWRRQHEWQEYIANRSKGSGCPFCSGRRACPENCLQTVNPILAVQWHPTNNGTLTPSDVTAGSGKKVWWQCNRGHTWEASINSRTKGNGCPFCSNWLVCADNCLQTIAPNLASQWHPNNNGSLTPTSVTARSKKKVWWQCEKGHEWEATIYSRRNGAGCPFCSGNRACVDNCLQTTNPDLSKQWNIAKNNNLTPCDVTPGSNKKVWWVCDKGHEWESIIYNRVRGNGCPYCSGRLVWAGNAT